jgi:putative oxidoreductase
MPLPLQGLLTLLGRIVLCSIFFGAAVGSKIPEYQKVSADMIEHKIPAAEVLLAGAILFLIVGSLSIVFGVKARFGALLLFIFLVAATYYFHDFWTLEERKARLESQMQFMKNVALMGAMIFIMGNGAGRWSFDARSTPPVQTTRTTQHPVAV